MDNSTERVLSAIERNRSRIWRLCYRMTGSSADADELAQESFARAIERSAAARSADPTGWLFRIATTTCLDALRRQETVRRTNQLVDAVELPPLLPAGFASPEDAVLLREELRYAIIVALQHLPPRQRAALVLREACGRSVDEIAETLGVTPNTCKVTLFRARTAIRELRSTGQVDLDTDTDTVDRFARAIESGDADRIAAVLAEDVWGLVDGGNSVRAATKPTLGRRAAVRRWHNAMSRMGNPTLRCVLARLNGQDAIDVFRQASEAALVAVVHVETNGGLIQSICVDRDAERLNPTRRQIH